MTLRTLALIAALWLACAVGAMAQGNGGGNPEVISNTDQPVGIGSVSDLVDACNQESGNEGILYYLNADIEYNGAFKVNSCLKLDLQGHSITSSGVNCFVIYDNATLSIVDYSTGDQKGSIICTYNVVSDAIYIHTGAKLIADGVTITCANGSAIGNYEGKAEISGCTVIGVKGIYNEGTTTVTGGSISGTFISIYNDHGTISMNTGENPTACTIYGGEFGIANYIDGAVTLGSDVYIANCTNSGIFNSSGTVTLNAWPTFSAGSTASVSDILLFPNQKITIGSAITAAPAKKISVRAIDIGEKDIAAAALPYTFTSGYASHVIDGSRNVIDPAEVFTYYKITSGFAVELGGDNNSEATLVFAPSKVSVTFAFAEGQEWMTWCSEASIKKPAGIDAYRITGATTETITVEEITASDASLPALLPAYTPLLLRKNGAEGLTAEQYAVPTAPTDDLFTNYGIVSQATTDCTVFGSTKAVAAAASSQVFALGRTYMLKSGEFVAVDQFDGIAANRCWLTLSGTPAASRLLIRTGDATDIRTVGPGPAPSDDHWYSLTGIRLEKRPDRKGIYLNGGKKVIIK